MFFGLREKVSSPDGRTSAKLHKQENGNPKRDLSYARSSGMNSVSLWSGLMRPRKPLAQQYLEELDLEAHDPSLKSMR